MRHEYLGPRPELFGSALDMFINTNLMLIHDNKSGARRNTPISTQTRKPSDFVSFYEPNNPRLSNLLYSQDNRRLGKPSLVLKP